MREQEEILDEIFRLVSEQKQLLEGRPKEEQASRTQRIQNLFECVAGEASSGPNTTARH